MLSSDDAGARATIVQMNAELRHAQLEMLSAQCATDRVRLRYSLEDIARHAQRDVLRKAWSSASALYEYYNSIIRQVPDSGVDEKSDAPELNEAKVGKAIVLVADFLRAQRELFRPSGVPLDRDRWELMEPFFSPTLLEQIRTVRLTGQRVTNPAFYMEARAMGIKNLPDMTQMPSLTFEDVLVFQGEITTRPLFHALVHAVQFEVLGLERYSELFVRAFLRTRSHVTVPLEVHTIQLESKFAETPGQSFSVEEKVRLWTNQGRY
jgi:hypothetical protein